MHNERSDLRRASDVPLRADCRYFDTTRGASLSP